MIATRLIRELTVSVPSSPERSRKLSAASGLVQAGGFLYVIADDENHLGVFPAHGDGDGVLVRLFDGHLPEGKRMRKASKADPEALTLLPAFDDYPFGALLAWGSGSRPTRLRGAICRLDRAGAPDGAPRTVDLATLYAGLAQRFVELNIEGAVVSGDAMVLLQRGSRKAPENACIRLALAPLLRSLTAGTPPPAPSVLEVHIIELGSIAGTPLSFTDAGAMPGGRVLFTAVAENAKDSYEDGPCAGAALGVIEPDGSLAWIELLAAVLKIEGVHVLAAGETIDLMLVTDADDAAVPAQLLAAHLPLSPPCSHAASGSAPR